MTHYRYRAGLSARALYPQPYAHSCVPHVASGRRPGRRLGLDVRSRSLAGERPGRARPAAIRAVAAWTSGSRQSGAYLTMLSVRGGFDMGCACSRVPACMGVAYVRPHASVASVLVRQWIAVRPLEASPAADETCVDRDACS